MMNLRTKGILPLAVVVALSSVVLTWSSSAHADVLVKQEFKFFKVRGETSQQIFREFQKNSPIKAKGKYDATLGVAAIRLTPEVQYETKGKRCRVANAKVHADIVIHLPRWTNYKRADEQAKAGWDKLFSDIKTHELQHAAIAKDYAGRIQRKIESFLPRSSCDKLEAVLKKQATKLLGKHDQAQLRFDQKEYGRFLKRR